MELAWSPAAVDDLEAAVGYIESELASPVAAMRLVDSAIEKAQLLADVPGAGTALRALSGIDTGHRYVVCGNWMVFLECDSGRALVVRVLYAKSDCMRTLFGEIDSERWSTAMINCDLAAGHAREHRHTLLGVHMGKARAANRRISVLTC